MIKLKTCPSCGSEELQKYLKTKDYFFTKEEYFLEKCNVCHLVFTNPKPAERELSKYYKTEKYLSHNATSSNPITLIYKSVRNVSIKRKFRLISSFIKQGSILDIGCGTGELLAYFKRKNWKVSGVEPDANARLMAKKINKIDIENLEYLEKIEENSLDVITMWHVLEHVNNLHKRLETIKKMLKKGGIAFIAVPNILSHDAQYYKEYWAGLDVPRHLYHFSSQSMENILSMHQLSVIKRVPMKFDSFYVSWLSEQYLGHRFPFLRGVLKGFQFNKMAKTDDQYSSLIFIVKADK